MTCLALQAHECVTVINLNRTVGVVGRSVKYGHRPWNYYVRPDVHVPYVIGSSCRSIGEMKKITDSMRGSNGSRVGGGNIGLQIKNK